MISIQEKQKTKHNIMLQPILEVGERFDKKIYKCKSKSQTTKYVHKWRLLALCNMMSHYVVVHMYDACMCSVP